MPENSNTSSSSSFEAETQALRLGVSMRQTPLTRATSVSSVVVDKPPPSTFVCPITDSVMKDPVVDREGNTYERAAICEWLGKNKLSPVTRNPLRPEDLAPNRALREMIKSYMGDKWVVEADSANPAPTTKKPREAINEFLEDISRAVGKDLSLNHNGICAFTYEHLTIVIEVPEKVGSFFIYSSISNRSQFQDGEALFEKCLRLNYLQQETRGGCLSLDPINDEIMFSYTENCSTINSTDFRNILENFIDTALQLGKEVDKLKPTDEEKESNSKEEDPATTTAEEPAAGEVTAAETAEGPVTETDGAAAQS